MIDKENRLCLQFSRYSSEQREVVKLLKKMGRKKSAFITKAIQYYMENCPAPEVPGVNIEINNILTESLIKKTIKQMIRDGEIMPAPAGDKTEEAPQKPKKATTETKKQEVKIETPSVEKVQQAPAPEMEMGMEAEIEAAADMLDMLDAFDEDIY